jgi:hypothetical protein
MRLLNGPRVMSKLLYTFGWYLWTRKVAAPQCFCCITLRDLIFMKRDFREYYINDLYTTHAVVCWVTAHTHHHDLSHTQHHHLPTQHLPSMRTHAHNNTITSLSNTPVSRSCAHLMLSCQHFMVTTRVPECWNAKMSSLCCALKLINMSVGALLTSEAKPKRG